MQGTLSVVATPLGNLEDITLRALRVLGACDVVVCEDTRVTAKLLAHYDIKKPLVSYHAHSGEATYEKVLELLGAGKWLALVSDAGTPTISDPGAHLVAAVRAQFDEVRIEAIPGPAAVTAALSVAGVPADAFHFLGFPPHKKGRQTFFTDLGSVAETTVFYESPHRLLKALALLAEHLPSAAQVIVVRELTKIHEQVVSGSAVAVHEHFLAHPDTVRGECVIIVHPRAHHARRGASCVGGVQ